MDDGELVHAEIKKETDTYWTESRWREQRIPYSTYSISVEGTTFSQGSPKRETIYAEKHFCDNHKVCKAKSFLKDEPEVCDFLKKYLERIAMPIIAEKERLRLLEEAETKRIQEETAKLRPHLLKTSFGIVDRNENQL
jgi:hypothetical protein